jgi:hypothetical protein
MNLSEIKTIPSHARFATCLDMFHEEAFIGTDAEGRVGRKGPRKTHLFSEDFAGNLILDHGPIPDHELEDVKRQIEQQG